jgi:hypothetical protein
VKSVSLSEFKHEVVPRLNASYAGGGQAQHGHAAGAASAGAAGGAAGSAGGEAALTQNYAPMFLPVDAGSKRDSGVIRVVTRQKFLDENIDHWVKWHTFRTGAVACALGAIVLLPVNVALSGAAALGAGYCYGQFKRKDFIVNNLLKHRWMLEGT